MTAVVVVMWLTVLCGSAVLAIPRLRRRPVALVCGCCEWIVAPLAPFVTQPQSVATLVGPVAFLLGCFLLVMGRPGDVSGRMDAPRGKR